MYHVLENKALVRYFFPLGSGLGNTSVTVFIFAYFIKKIVRKEELNPNGTVKLC